jgi:hypothetical protein
MLKEYEEFEHLVILMKLLRKEKVTLKFMTKYLHVNIFIEYTPGIDKIFDLGEVAVFKTAKSAASAVAKRAAAVVVKVPIQRVHDITEGSCRII